MNLNSPDLWLDLLPRKSGEAHKYQYGHPAEGPPIPTLSEWGLIAMAGVLGIIGLITISRSKVSA